MEELKEEAREELFFALLMCSKQTLLAFSSYGSLIPPPPSHLSCALFLTISLKCPLLRVIVQQTLSFPLLLLTVFLYVREYVCVCVKLDYRGGAVQSLASGVNEPHDEARRAETPTHPPLPQYPDIPTQSHKHAHTYIHTHCTNTCAPLTSNICIFHKKPSAE